MIDIASKYLVLTFSPNEFVNTKYKDAYYMFTNRVDLASMSDTLGNKVWAEIVLDLDNPFNKDHLVQLLIFCVNALSSGKTEGISFYHKGKFYKVEQATEVYSEKSNV